MFLGRTVKVGVVLLADLFLYMAVLSLSLRLGPDGLGPRVFQLGLAIALPAALTYRTLWKKRRERVLRKPLAGMLMASVLTPAFLAQVPIASLACSAALMAAPYYAPRHLPQATKRLLRMVGGAAEDGDGWSRIDLLLLKRHVLYLRWRGGDVSGKEFKVVKSAGIAYLRIAKTGISDSKCREKALAAGLRAIVQGRGIAVPATGEEVRCLEGGEGLPAHLVRRAKDEDAALGPLSLAWRRALTCRREGLASEGGMTADVVVCDRGDMWTLKVLSGRAIPMGHQRLRDLLDLYKMVAAG